MTDTISPAANAADAARACEPIADETIAATVPADDTHGMRPIALAFVACNAAVLAVFALVVATGHLDVGGLGDVLLTTATAAPTN